MESFGIHLEPLRAILLPDRRVPAAPADRAGRRARRLAARQAGALHGRQGPARDQLQRAHRARRPRQLPAPGRHVRRHHQPVRRAGVLAGDPGLAADRLQRPGPHLHHRPARARGLVRAEHLRRAAGAGLRLLLRALRGRRGHGLLPQHQAAGCRVPRQARAVRDHGVRGADRARPDQGRRRHRARELPRHPGRRGVRAGARLRPRRQGLGGRAHRAAGGRASASLRRDDGDKFSR